MSFNRKQCSVVLDKDIKSSKKRINDWFKRGNIKIKKFDLILSKIDFGTERRVYVSNNPFLEDGFYYSINGKNFNDILLVFSRRICVRTSDKEELYEYVEDSLAEDGFRMVKIKSRRHNISNNWWNCLSESDLNSNYFLLYNNDYSIRLNVSYNTQDKLSKLEASEFDNYLELERYLTSLTFPCSILDVFKKICEISLDDVSQYKSLILSFSRNLEANRKKETDKIVLKDGKLCELKITIFDGKVINMNKLGDFSYDLTDESVSFSIKELGNGEISYSVSSNADKKIDDYMDGLMTYDISVARHELSDVKKRVRVMFPNTKG